MDRSQSLDSPQRSTDAEAATVTVLQNLDEGGGPSISSDSVSQSSAQSLACSGPNSLATAVINADNSHSAKRICVAQFDMENDSLAFIVFTSPVHSRHRPGTVSGIEKMIASLCRS